MNAERDFDAVARAWLELMPDEAPDRTITAVLQAVEETPQAVAPTAIVRRVIVMNRFVSAGMAAAVLIAGATFLVVSRTPSDVGNPNASSPPVVSPSASASAHPVALAPVPDALRSIWVAEAPSIPELGNAPGAVSLNITTSGTNLSATNFGAGGGFSSTVDATAADQITLTLDRASAACAVGAAATYRWSLLADGSLLKLDPVDDACPTRATALGRTWMRSLRGAPTMGAGIIDSMDPLFSIKLPNHAFETRTLDDFIEIAAPDGYSLMVHKNPQVFADACSTDEKRLPYKPGAQAFVDAFKKNDAFVVSDVRELTLSGHHTLHATIGGKANYARCPGNALYEYTPRNCVCHFIVGQGDADSMYLVEVGSDTFLFIISPIGTDDELAVMQTLRIPATLPAP